MNNEHWMKDYIGLRVVGDKLCGVRRYLYTWGLCYGLTHDKLEGRFCFQHFEDALTALLKSKQLDMLNPPPARFIKHKGRIEYTLNHLADCLEFELESFNTQHSSHFSPMEYEVLKSISRAPDIVL